MLGSGFMKKILGVIVLGLLLSGNAYAESKLLETENHKAFKISTVCIDGYKFVVTNHYAYAEAGNASNRSVSNSTSVNTIQFMITENGIMVPAQCN